MDADIALVSPTALAPYSGMLPGWMAGHYTWRQICLDFAQLCTRASARLVESEALALDLPRKTLQLANGEVLPFDFLSLNIGSTHRPPLQGRDDAVLPLRPLGSLVQRTQAFIEQHRHSNSALAVRVIGAGGAGFEMALAMQHHLHQVYPGRQIDVRIITDGSAPLPTHSAATQRLALHALKQRGVQLITHTSVECIEEHTLHLKSDNRSMQEQADTIVWAAGAQPHLWPQHSELALDARGFVAVNAALQSTSHPFVFAAGDCAGLTPPLPKAGVYPVRQGPLLAANLARALHAAPLTPYQPQPRALALFATGPKHAIASYGTLTFAGGWLWQWKNHIDQAFLHKHLR